MHEHLNQGPYRRHGKLDTSLQVSGLRGEETKAVMVEPDTNSIIVVFFYKDCGRCDRCVHPELFYDYGDPDADDMWWDNSCS
jgi:hypothetical protein